MLCSYYAYWERRLFSAVCSMVVSALQALTERMQACRVHGGVPREGDDAESVGTAPKLPLFRVRACDFKRCSGLGGHRCLLSSTCSPARTFRHLSPPLSSSCQSPSYPPPPPQVALQLMAPEVVAAPSATEVGRQLGRLMRNLVESARPFTRWMDATCLEAPEQ